MDVSCPSLRSRRCSEFGLAAGLRDEVRMGRGSASSSEGTVSGAAELLEWLCVGVDRLCGDCGLEACLELGAAGKGEYVGWLKGETSFSLK